MADAPDPRRHRPARRQLLRRRPAREVHVDARATRPCTSTPRTACGASRRTPRCSAMAKDPTTFSNAGGIRPDNGPDPDDDRHGRSRALEAAQAREQGLHAAAACATASRRSATCATRSSTTVCERGECDFVTRHRGAAADDPDRRHARRRARRPRRPAALVRRHGRARRAATRPKSSSSAAMNAMDGVHRVLHARGRAAPGAPDRRPHERARARRGRRRPARAPTTSCTSRC